MNKMKSNYLSVLLLGGLLSFGLFSCKSSKKAADASNAQQEQVADAQAEEEEEVDIDLDVAEEEESQYSDHQERLGKYFAVISSPSTSEEAAQNSINEMKSLFAGPTVPVLIIIYEGSSGAIDYDEPTNIMDYLNYLKDQKKNLNKVKEFKTNSNGKITELVLIRK